MAETAIVAGGCFWCTEAVFRDVIGVSKVESGYIGGTVAEPDLQAGLLGQHRPCRGDPRDLRSGHDLAGGDARRVPGHARSDPAQPPGQRRRHPVPHARSSRSTTAQRAEAEAAIARWNADHPAAAGGHHDRGPRPSGIRPRTTIRNTGKAKASGTPIAWR